jgi:mannose-1-phosphate guanylyltransferase
MAAKIIPVILSGGAGTRLWPMSRAEKPKQLLPVTEASTMLQLTAGRAAGDQFEPPIIVASALHADEIERQLGEIGVVPQALILEPSGRNTAVAIALAAIAAGGGDVLLLVMPSDHQIGDLPAFHGAIDRARPLALDRWLLTFGIEPTGPETGYGYIKVGEPLAAGVHKADRFIEKPQLDAATAMIEQGGYSWNGGIFLFRADTYLEELGRLAPDIRKAADGAMAASSRDNRRISPLPERFALAPAISVDNAVMELSDRVAVVPVAMAWSDVGSWDALYDLSSVDNRGNAIQGNVVALDVSTCLIRSDGIRVAAIGVADLIVVANGNDVLIVPRGQSQDIRKLSAPVESGSDSAD